MLCRRDRGRLALKRPGWRRSRHPQPEHDSSGLRITSDRRLPERLFDALSGAEAGAMIVRPA
jgi:hypothetical protein